jgi:hypothetical protein
MKKIAKSLLPLAALVLVGTCLVTVFDLLVVLMTSVGLANEAPSSYYQILDIPFHKMMTFTPLLYRGGFCFFARRSFAL